MCDCTTERSQKNEQNLNTTSLKEELFSNPKFDSYMVNWVKNKMKFGFWEYWEAPSFYHLSVTFPRGSEGNRGRNVLRMQGREKPRGRKVMESLDDVTHQTKSMQTASPTVSNPFNSRISSPSLNSSKWLIFS